MFKKLLDFVVENKIYIEIKGLTIAGSEKILNKVETHYSMAEGKIIFTGEMVDSILFHSRGCTITLKH